MGGVLEYRVYNNLEGRYSLPLTTSRVREDRVTLFNNINHVIASQLSYGYVDVVNLN